MGKLKVDELIKLCRGNTERVLRGKSWCVRKEGEGYKVRVEVN